MLYHRLSQLLSRRPHPSTTWFRQTLPRPEESQRLSFQQSIQKLVKVFEEMRLMKSGSSHTVATSPDKLTFLDSILSRPVHRCSMFCGGRRCKYESIASWKKADVAVDGLYSHWVTDDLLAMARPNTENMSKHNTVQQFKNVGIKSIINLQTPGTLYK